MEIEVDGKALIKLVEEKPLLWDRTTENYKNRLATKMAWYEIALRLVPEFCNMDEIAQQRVTRLLVQKWTHMRDNYNRSIKKMVNPGDKFPKPYIHNKHMKFLGKIMQIRPSDSEGSTSTNDNTDNNDSSNKLMSKRNDEVTDSDMSDDSEDSVNWKPTPQKHKSDAKGANTSTEDHPKHVGKKMTPFDDPLKNRHIAFFHSILPTVETFDDNEVLEFQIGTLQVLKNIKSGRNVKLQFQSATTSVSFDATDEIFEMYKKEAD